VGGVKAKVATFLLEKMGAEGEWLSH